MTPPQERTDARPTTPLPSQDTSVRVLELAISGGLLPVLAQDTAIPGVVLTPHVTGKPLRFTGDWVLTHAASGMQLTLPGCHAHMIEAIEWLARRAGLDWNRPLEAVRADDALKIAHGELNLALWRAREEREPLVTARGSWVVWPPRWRIRYRGRVSAATYDSWDDAARRAAYALTEPDEALHLHPDAEIVRDTRPPGWGLRCASIHCHDSHFLADWADGCGPVMGPRAQLAADAAEEGWRDCGAGTWTCPECSRRYH
ncbi:hypothetical protein [Amycolatopsis sp. CA-128772]|uniref:hypothetical protein n=1 Tax=Amycolatopsis sp. CA-128772 TaxID=2073159 RepID=UPI0011AFEE29|nr:hypothetical protein [Amycolatopsis sp. CA-128772]